MLLAVPVSLCDNQEPATPERVCCSLTESTLLLLSPSSSLPVSLLQDEGPQHLISTSAVKVQRLFALLHIMKEEGGPLILLETRRKIG